MDTLLPNPTRQVEQTSASSCTYRSIIVNPGKEFCIRDVPHDEEVPATILEPGTVVRISPMEKKCGGWAREHFHPLLCLPEQCSIREGIVVTFEAMARECIAVALSPDTDFIMGKTYAIHLGANGNLSTVIRRRLPNGYDFIDATFSSIRVCTPESWTPYWIVCHKGKISVGIGRIPGNDCIGTLDDSMYDALRPGQDAVRYVGLGNSAVGRPSQRFGNVKVRNLKVMPLPPSVLARGHLVMEEIAPHTLLKLHAPQNSSGNAIVETEVELLREYENECAKARARAAKFGTAYVEPPPDAFFKWSEARRLRANPQRGFVTGFDTTSLEEEAKRQARKERFATKRKADTVKMEDQDTIAGDANNDDVVKQENEIKKENEEGASDGEIETVEPRPPLSVVEAWDNEELTRDFRVDPMVTEGIESAAVTDLTVGMETVAARNDSEEADDMDADDPAELVPEKIHVFAIDWAAFKQIRSDDLMAYFSLFGPSYVEWLGELSCNVLFQDRFSAARAMTALSQPLPSPPPEEVSMEHPPDFGKMGWRFCIKPIRKNFNDRFGRKGTRARLLLRVANSNDVLEKRPTHWPRPPPGFSTRRVLGPGSDLDTSYRTRGGDGDGEDQQRRFPKRQRRGDGGQRGGRGGRPVRSAGRKGRRLHEGESGEEFYEEEMTPEVDSDDRDRAARSALDRGLKSSRPGFSIEELEAERAAKRAGG